MATYRSVHLSFWTDTKVTDDLTPEDRYFMLYCLTNPHTNIIGCYEISIKQIADEMGYTKESVENLIKRFQNIHKMIEYDRDNKELFIRNWYKYNWSSSPKLDNALLLAIKEIKTDKFRKELVTQYNKRETVSIPYTYTIHTSDTVSNKYSNSDNDLIEQIIEYFNNKAGKRYKASSQSTKRVIHARLSEKFTLEDFKAVIDYKVSEWKGTKMEDYLRPETLFGTKFESYLNSVGNGFNKQTSQPKVDGSGYKVL